MTAKEYLSQANKIARRIEIDLQKIERLHQIVEYKGALSETTGASKGTAENNMEKIICSTIDYERRTLEKIAELVKLYGEIENAIQSVTDPTAAEILERRYLLCQPWEDKFDERTGACVEGIATAMHFSPRQIYRLHSRALNAIAKNENMAVDVSECQ